MRRTLIALLVGIFLAMVFALQANARAPIGPETIIVKFKKGVAKRSQDSDVISTGSLPTGIVQSFAQYGIGELRAVFVVGSKGPQNPKAFDSLGLSDIYYANVNGSQTAKSAVTSLSTSPHIEYAEQNHVWKLLESDVIPNDPGFALQWHYHHMLLPYAWNLTTGSSNVIVGVIDSGIDYNHPDLQSRIAVNWTEYSGFPFVDDDFNGLVDDVIGWDFYNWDNDPMDDHSHGTHVAGTIGAMSNNGLGVSGVDWNCLLLPMKVGNAVGSVDQLATSAAIFYGTNMGCQILNLSLGGVLGSQIYEDANNYALTNGVLVVAAMGNENSSTPLYPAAYPSTLAIGATDSLFQRWYWNPTQGSNVGNHIDFCAPGDYVYSTIPRSFNPSNPYDHKTGTSMATPHVSGLAALLLAARPDFTPDSLYWYIRWGCIDQIGHPLQDVPGWDIYYGWGLVNARYSLELAIGCTCSPCYSDPVCDGVIDVFDVVAAVDVAFRGGSDISDSGCPLTRCDVVCDAVIDVFDVVGFVDVAFRGGTQLTTCDPCVQ